MISFSSSNVEQEFHSLIKWLDHNDQFGTNIEFFNMHNQQTYYVLLTNRENIYKQQWV